jgi:hypothetical protein
MVHMHCAPKAQESRASSGQPSEGIARVTSCRKDAQVLYSLSLINLGRVDAIYINVVRKGREHITTINNP